MNDAKVAAFRSELAQIRITGLRKPDWAIGYFPLKNTNREGEDFCRSVWDIAQFCIAHRSVVQRRTTVQFLVGCQTFTECVRQFPLLTLETGYLIHERLWIHGTKGNHSFATWDIGITGYFTRNRFAHPVVDEDTPQGIELYEVAPDGLPTLVDFRALDGRLSLTTSP